MPLRWRLAPVAGRTGRPRRPQTPAAALDVLLRQPHTRELITRARRGTLSEAEIRAVAQLRELLDSLPDSGAGSRLARLASEALRTSG